MKKDKKPTLSEDEFWRHVEQQIKEGNIEAMKLWARYHRPGDPPKDIEYR